MQAAAQAKAGPSSAVAEYLVANTFCCQYLPEKSEVTGNNKSGIETAAKVDQIPETMSGKLFQRIQPQILNNIIIRSKLEYGQNMETFKNLTFISQEIMIDHLVKMWLELDVDVPMLIQLADTLIPILVLGLVKVLQNAITKNMIHKEKMNESYNPLNILAQYLIRFNPKYDNSIEMNAYVHGMRCVSDVLRERINDHSQVDSLSHLIQETRNRRLMREKIKREKEKELASREGSLSHLFDAWNTGYKVNILSLKNALFSYEFSLLKLSAQNRKDAQLNGDVHNQNFMMGSTLYKLKFIEIMMSLVTAMSKLMFEKFYDFMMEAAERHQEQIAKDERKKKLDKLFNYIVITPAETINRQKIICLLIYFYDNQPKHTQEMLKNPKKWPVIDLTEMKPTRMNDLLLLLTSQQPVDTHRIKDEDPCLAIYKRNEPDPMAEDLVDRYQFADKVDGINLDELLEVQTDQVLASNEEDLADINMFLYEDQLPENISMTQATVIKSSDIWNELFHTRNNLNNQKPNNDYIIVASYKSSNEKTKFDRRLLTINQFSELCEHFLHCKAVEEEFFMYFCNFMKNASVINPKDREIAASQAKINAEIKNLSVKLDRLFEIWDPHCSGQINIKYIVSQILGYQEKTALGAIMESLNNIKKKFNFEKDLMLNKKQFEDMMISIFKSPTMVPYIETLLTYLLHSQTIPHDEHIVSTHRLQIMKYVRRCIEVAMGDMDVVYDTIFKAVKEDCKRFNERYDISGTISLCRPNFIDPREGDLVLTYVAGTFDVSPILPGFNKFFREAIVSTNVMQSGNINFIRDILNEKNIDFWSTAKYSMVSECQGIRIPIKNDLNQVFGIMCIDNALTFVNPCTGVTDSQTSTVMTFNEKHLLFYHGLARLLSEAYYEVSVNKKLLKTLKSYLYWLMTRCTTLIHINAFLSEHDLLTNKHMLKQFISFEKNKELIVFEEPIKLLQNKNLFRLYLFKCFETGMMTFGSLYGEKRAAIPIRNHHGEAQIVVEINMGKHSELNALDLHEVSMLTRLLNQSYKEILIEMHQTPKKKQLAIDDLGLIGRIHCRFDCFLLQEQKSIMAALLTQAEYDKVRTGPEYAPAVLAIFRAVFLFLRPELIAEKILDKWQNYRLYLNDSLNDEVNTFDPTNPETTNHIDLFQIESLLFDKKKSGVVATNFVVAILFYDWCLICISLMKMSRDLRNKGHFY